MQYPRTRKTLSLGLYLRLSTKRAHKVQTVLQNPLSGDAVKR